MNEENLSQLIKLKAARDKAAVDYCNAVFFPSFAPEGTIDELGEAFQDAQLDLDDFLDHFSEC